MMSMHSAPKPEASYHKNNGVMLLDSSIQVIEYIFEVCYPSNETPCQVIVAYYGNAASRYN